MENVRAGKRKRILRLTGITIGVYLTFRYLLPVVIPFLFGAVLAVLLKKPYRWLIRKLRMPKGVSAVLVTSLLTALLAAVCFFLIREGLFQAGNLAENLPGYVDKANLWMMNVCEKYEKMLKLEDGEVFDWLSAQWNQGLEQIGSRLMTALVDNSVALVNWTVKVGTGLVVIFLAAVLFLLSWDKIGQSADRSPFREEIFTLKSRLMNAGMAYIKSQLIIMALTAVVCSAGLALMGNPYSILNGVVIGFLDALPLFGTGTVFIPWVIIELIRREWMRALGLAVIYLICYFLREILEAKIMGNSMGLSQLESLAAIYVGIRLFGIAGVILGPFGLIAIRELYGFDEQIPA